ncbi:MAG TPA: hypothetical protein VKU83_11210 [Puia sp.]|nr:hypothetical protein [Puia sp.]
MAPLAVPFFIKNDLHMPDFAIPIDIYVLAALLTLAVLAGFGLGKQLLAKQKRKTAELEREMMQAHAELLETQRGYCELESKVKEEGSLVIPIKKKIEPGSAPSAGKSENF